MYGVGRPLVNLRSEAPEWDLGGSRWADGVQPSARCRIGLWPRCVQVAGIKADTFVPEDPGPNERIPDSPPACTGASSAAARQRGKRPSGQPSLQPCLGPFAIHLCGYRVSTFIVSRSATFINTCTNTILARVMACGSDSAITSDTLIPLFASN